MRVFSAFFVRICLWILVCGCWNAATAQAPRIDKIDPPNWWIGLPSPMLLVHGAGLDHAHFRIEGKDVTLDRTQESANGHWAFLWIGTGKAHAQKIWIDAANAQGTTRQAYELAQRSQDPAAHSGFSSSDAMYLIMTDRFAHGGAAPALPDVNRALPRGWHGGNFAGIEEHLDYLKQLGVTTVWTTPVASNAGMKESYHGYAATDLYAVDPHFGTLADYRRLSDALHARGMKLVIDLVPNHIGVNHPWVSDPPAPEWLHGTLAKHLSSSNSDFYQLVSPHAAPQDWLHITNGWFTDAMPDLNQENPLVEKYLIQNAMWWVETANLDGIRLDTFPYVGRAFWHDYDTALHKAFPRLTMVGEVFNGDPMITSFFAGGVAHRGIDTDLDTPFDFPVYFALVNVIAHDHPMTELAHVLAGDSLYPHPERLVPFAGNHDTVRFVTQAGGSVPKLKLALGLVTTLRGMPLIYSGDEIAMSGGADPDNRHDFPGGFAGDKQDAFTQAGRTATQQEAFAWTSGLLKLREAHAAFKTGLEQNLFADDDALAFVRATNASGCTNDSQSERFLIVVNKSAKSKTIDLATADSALAGCTVFHPVAPTSGTDGTANGGKLHIEEPAESMTIFEVR